MASTTSKAIKCTCASEFQDQTYGFQMRLHSKKKQKISSDKTWACTICGKEKTDGSGTTSVSNTKGKKK